MRLDRIAILAAPLALGACAAVPSATPPIRSTYTSPTQRPAPQVQTVPGLEGVIGADEQSLIRQFGQPRLNVVEEDAVKLQWSGIPCILDIYLYPPKSGGRPTATYVDARRGDGRDVDRAACVAALRSLQGGR
ncbi:hypothetical protein RXV95_01420 [Novosphingobium sp. ZN18A2]|uniref:hypothetical protein n=1 Tax=Novosphingobium sp. ZN18A2 TaxID=3079861 RepID=UPI0030D37BA4